MTHGANLGRVSPRGSTEVTEVSGLAIAHNEAIHAVLSFGTEDAVLLGDHLHKFDGAVVPIWAQGWNDTTLRAISTDALFWRSGSWSSTVESFRAVLALIRASSGLVVSSITWGSRF